MTSIKNHLEEDIAIKQQLLTDVGLHQTLQVIIDLLVLTFNHKRRLFIVGNGGSAVDAMHIAAEYSGRYRLDRPALAAEALTANVAFVTAVANDYDYQVVFERAVEAHVQKEDCVILLSTSGNSKNVLKAAEKANELGANTISFSGQAFADLAQLAKFSVIIPSKNTARIQENYLLLNHYICEQVEQTLFGL